MNKKYFLKIGALHFTKKAILLIMLGFFLNGILIGTSVYLNIRQDSNFKIYLYFPVLILIWYFLIPFLKKEITEK